MSVISHYDISCIIWKKVRLFQFGILSHLPAWVPAQHKFLAAYHWLMTHHNNLITSGVRDGFDQYYVSSYVWIFGIILLCAGSYLFLRAYKRHISFNITTIAVWLSHRFPWISSYIKDKPETKNSKYITGADNTYAQAITPAQFVKMYPPQGLNTSVPIFEEKHLLFHEEVAHKVFIKQLDNGTKTQGEIKIIHLIQNKEKYIDFDKTLESFSIAEKKFYQSILPHISVGSCKVEVKAKRQVDENQGKVIKDISKREQVIANLFKYHHYTRTFLMSLYELSMQNGSTPVSNYPWLLKEDRTLFLSLSSVGRR